MDGLCKIYLPYYLILLVCVSNTKREDWEGAADILKIAKREIDAEAKN